jgi:hypothetical protein
MFDVCHRAEVSPATDVFLRQILSADMLTPQAGCNLTDIISLVITLVIIFNTFLLSPNVIYVTQFLVLCFFILSTSIYSLLPFVNHFNKLD